MKGKKKNILIWLAWALVAGLALFATIMVFGSNGTSWPEQVMAACLGALITIMATRLLLSTQREGEKEQELYNKKLGVYSDYVSEMYEALSDGNVTSDELKKFRTKLFATVGFYAEDDVFKQIYDKVMEHFFEKKKENESKEGSKLTNDPQPKMAKFFADITNILQNDIQDKKEKMKFKNKGKINVMDLWNKFKDIIDYLEKAEEEANKDNENTENNILGQKTESSNEIIGSAFQDQQTEQPNEKCLKQQAWHFNMLSDVQLESLRQEKEQYELNLIEYGEYWRTNLVKQVGYGDIIMLFKRGANGYWGAYKAIGTRIFNFDEKKETITWLDNRENPTIIPETDPQYQKDIEDFDIYKSRDDGATLCSSIIVKKIAFKEGGVGNPGGVYRRTISRYYPLYAGRLMKLFEDAEAENPGKIINPDEKDAYNYVN